MDGKKHHLFKDLTGQRFGMLIAIQPSHRTSHGWVWEFKCDCGNTKLFVGAEIRRQAVLHGRTTNCGCSTKRLIGEGNTRHGMSDHPAYAVWRSMMDRCRLPTHQAWANYGARGIAVCARWRERFEHFWEDMGPTYQSGLDLDRKDNNGDYSPENCWWTTRRNNTMNRRDTIRDVDIPRLSAEMGVARSTLYYRKSRGMDLLAPNQNTGQSVCTTSSTPVPDTAL